ncbi:helix-turn-helix domain-containing protein [Staphylococcus pseudintermedius]|uniref:helix-turn-helix domain-containing protein n=1 Tax=Staphylococcus pseudintermedius TaxID=283734 RepID=UPI0019D94957|nr:S24 family peptidase [Staphylococcus pseudintermedius]EGQ2773793.1 helix-turn-helix transcriptional regulator [Staphylococcus pseudintermedius]EGQ3392081.1 helix-turn-helix transcriptional regulator [Staphylococcus pseudintermedius]EJD8460906.1 helix-turn-helix transcriptional regulator [Staphylococcus pseudintermedius]MCE5572840.1 helix-turn-helix transcriptional regulator [Staphylococcus pseudintermedius]MDK4179028.1 helix-turn-helix domain-containing protein [Staphylococcus pseudintermed
MTSFSSNLERLMNKRDMSDSDLAALVDVNRTTVTRWRKGIRSPKLDKLPEIANVFGVEPLDLISESNIQEVIAKINDVSSQLTPPRQKRVLDFANEQLNEQNNKVLHINSNNIVSEEVAVYGYASAGTGETLIDGVEFTMQYNGHIPNHDFALQVNGDSMEPLFEDKEIIFIDKTKQINSGQIGIFVIDGEAYLKKVFINEEGIRLVSLNPKYPDLNFDSSHDIKVAGKVIL